MLLFLKINNLLDPLLQQRQAVLIHQVAAQYLLPVSAVLDCPVFLLQVLSHFFGCTGNFLYQAQPVVSDIHNVFKVVAAAGITAPAVIGGKLSSQEVRQGQYTDVQISCQRDSYRLVQPWLVSRIGETQYSRVIRHHIYGDALVGKAADHPTGRIGIKS